MTRRDKLITIAGIVVLLLLAAGYMALYLTAYRIPGE